MKILFKTLVMFMVLMPYHATSAPKSKSVVTSKSTVCGGGDLNRGYINAFGTNYPSRSNFISVDIRTLENEILPLDVNVDIETNKGRAFYAALLAAYASNAQILYSCTKTKMTGIFVTQ